LASFTPVNKARHTQQISVLGTVPLKEKKLSLEQDFHSLSRRPKSGSYLNTATSHACPTNNHKR
jgi:hypothetical protein